MGNKKKKIIVAVSGGFDPIHIGHVRMFREAKKLGDKLIVILNNDNWLIKKKGYVFMSQKERKELIQAFGVVDKIVFTRHTRNTEDMSVSEDIKRIKPDIFANGGDRKTGNIRIIEIDVCNEIGCKMVFNVGRGGKVQSSSWLLAGFTQRAFCPCGSGKKYKRCHGT